MFSFLKLFKLYWFNFAKVFIVFESYLNLSSLILVLPKDLKHGIERDKIILQEYDLKVTCLQFYMILKS